jgi:methylated-DNA-[protein]-cysteine S-methyltransferase
MTTGKLISTPLGWVAAAARDGKLVAVSLPDPDRQTAQTQLPPDSDCTQTDAVLEAFADDLGRYFAGARIDLSRYPVDLSALPPFLQRALRAAEQVPYGEVRTYTWVATQAGNARAARAAGQAMHHNPVPLVIPCHRIVGSGGGLTGFGGGLDMKRQLLALEGVSLAAGGVASARQPRLPD